MEVDVVSSITLTLTPDEQKNLAHDMKIKEVIINDQLIRVCVTADVEELPHTKNVVVLSGSKLSK